MIRASDYIAEFVYHRLGVKDVFLLSGAGVMHLTDGIAYNGNLRAICTHHEQSASMAMDAYAKVTEKISVGYFTTGPGVTNALTGLAGAWQDSVPCLFISGQVKRSETVQNAGVSGLRQFGVQELNVLPIIKPISKYAVTINDPMQVRYELEKACHIALSGCPGPVWIEVPMDVQAAKINPDQLSGYQALQQKPGLDQEAVQKVVDWLQGAARPVIIAGRGVRLSGGVAALAKLAVALKSPVVTPFLGIDNMNHSQWEYIGKTGVKGDRAANLAMQNADLIIAIGSSLHVSVIGYEYEQFARDAKRVVVDIDATAHQKKTIRIDHFIQADARVFMEQLLSKTTEQAISAGPDWLQRCNHWKRKYPVCLPEYAQSQGEINIYSLIDALSKRAGAGAVFVSDAGSAYYATSQAIQLCEEGQRYVTSGAMATMGFSLPAAIGASVALGDKPVLAITGDGSLQMNIQELQTLVHYRLPVKLFVLNNDGYLSIRTSQKNYFDGRYIGEGPASGVSMPDTLKIAHAYGIPARRVSDLKDLPAVLDEVLKCDGPFICDVITPREQGIIPTVSSRINADGSMSSMPLEDMAPFLDRDELKEEMVVELLPASLKE